MIPTISIVLWQCLALYILTAASGSTGMVREASFAGRLTYYRYRIIM